MSKFSLKKLSPSQKKLRKRIIELSYNSNLSHLGSCLSAIDLIDAIYKIKKREEKFILSNGHAGIAWYSVLEKYGSIKNPKDTKRLNVHPDRNAKFGIHVSTGSLGQGLPIALGMAIANRNKRIYCMVSDGECTEGSIWESLRIINERKITNLLIIVNANGWSAYDSVNLDLLEKRIKGFGLTVRKIDGHNLNQIEKTIRTPAKKPTVILAYTTVEQFPFLKGQDAHYYILNKNDYNQAIHSLK